MMTKQIEVAKAREGSSERKKNANIVAKIGFKKANEIPLETSTYFKPTKNK